MGQYPITIPYIPSHGNGLMLKLVKLDAPVSVYLVNNLPCDMGIDSTDSRYHLGITARGRIRLVCHDGTHDRISYGDPERRSYGRIVTWVTP